MSAAEEEVGEEEQWQTVGAKKKARKPAPVTALEGTAKSGFAGEVLWDGRARVVSEEAAAAVLSLLRQGSCSLRAPMPEDEEGQSGPRRGRGRGHGGRRAPPAVKPADVREAACSEGTAALQKALKDGVGPSGNLTALHLAALTGHAGLAREIAAWAAELPLDGDEQGRWQDADGRTPLHYAAFFDDAALAQAFLGLCQPSLTDRWGLTAQEIAAALGHCWSAAALAGEPPTLQELCGRQLLQLLREDAAADPAQLAALLRARQGPGGVSAASVVPLHDYGALRRLAAALPEEVEAPTLLRSMSCMECWYADLLGKRCGPAVPGCLGLVKAWEDLASFQGGESVADEDGKVLFQAGRRGLPSELADRETFLHRFHARTGGVLAGMDWSNVMVIGGMVLACLTADNEEYRRCYKETDVDIYVVGLSGEAFHRRVAEIVSALPKAAGEDDREYFLSGEDVRRLRVEPVEERGWLQVVGVDARKPDGKGRGKRGFYREDRMPKVGHFITEIEGEKGSAEVLLERLKACRGRDCHCELRARPEARDGEATSTLVRTPQTLTACLRKGNGAPLPNVQVVLAPYESPAHLLFTTDIDCVAMGFDGKNLLATPRAREALKRRRNVVRPEKYMVRGEWRTEARLLKYAMRGFRVVDLGLRPGVRAEPDAAVADAVHKALPASPAPPAETQGRGRGRGFRHQPAPSFLRPEERKQTVTRVEQVRATGCHGARLLLQAAQDEGLRRLLLQEQPLLPAGLDRDDIVQLASHCRTMPGEEDDSEDSDYGPPTVKRGALEMNDGYGKARLELLVVNPSRLDGTRMSDYRLRRTEVRLDAAIAELDLESDRFEVRSWYEGLPESQLQQPHASLDPAVWRGVGDFRSAP